MNTMELISCRESKTVAFCYSIQKPLIHKSETLINIIKPGDTLRKEPL